MRNILAAFVLLATPSIVCAQNDNSSLPSGKKDPTVVVPGGQVRLGANGGISLVPVLSNSNYEVAPSFTTGETPWFSVSKRTNGGIKFLSDYWYKNETRNGKLVFNLANGKQVELDVVQDGNESSKYFTGDIKLTVARGEASQQNSSNESINKTFDGNYNTIYHSPYGKNTKFPVTLTYELRNNPHVDYIVCTPRSDQDNGRFGEVTISYKSKGDSDFRDIVVKRDFGFSDAQSTIYCGDNGIDDVESIKFTVYSGANNFVSCAEMEFYQHNTDETAGFTDVFADRLCSQLKPGVTKEDLDKVTNPFARQLGYYMLNNEYDTKYRVGEFEAYEDVWTLRSRLKTSNAYNQYENPTGIYFEENDNLIVFADGIDNNHPVSLIIKDFGDSYRNSNDKVTNPRTFFSLRNGVNVIKAPHKGNSYVSYYSNDYKNAPKIKLHFAMGRVCGYFDAERGDTNEDWKNLLATTCSDMIDVRTKRIQVCFPTSWFKQYCPEDAESYVLNIDSTIYYERDVMGLSKYGLEPKNRQFARKVWNGGMYADGEGAAAHDPSSWMVAERNKFGFWGFGHELGHNNQINPGFKWVGCGETTNNVYSAWVEFKLGPGNYRLETEVTGLNIFSNMKGGRFNSYLEAGVRQGVSWQLQCGPDYGGVPPTTEKTVRLFDYTGKDLGRDTVVVAGNYDHFIKLCPLWQLQLYCTQAGYSPDVYAKVFQDIRTHDYGRLTHGAQQLNFMKLVCDSTGLNFLPFFKKAGMFKPIKAYIEDYSPGWLIIDPVQIAQLENYVKEKGYKEIKEEVNYITALNWKSYKDKAPLTGSKNVGCSLENRNNTPFVKVDHKQWQNAVAFETYDQNGKLMRISMQGLGGDKENTYTMVMFPSGAAYIKAVGWDGTRMVCYEK